MNAIVLFRFHAEFNLCYERIKLIRALNPSLALCALYGGPAENSTAAARCLGPLVDGIWSIERGDARWKWQHQDIAVKEWYERHGWKLPFERLFDYEYDLILARPLLSAADGPADRSVKLSGLKPLSEVRRRWYWTTIEPFASGFAIFARFIAERYGLEEQSFVTQGPFPVLPRDFLEALCGEEYPENVCAGVNCETTYPAMAEALGFGIADTGLHPGWAAAIPSLPMCRLFHCERVPLVSVDDVLAELSSPLGRRAFHPVKEFVTAETILGEMRRGGEL